jgi:hypothetical protein
LHNGEDDEKYKSFTNDDIFNIVEYKKKLKLALSLKKKHQKNKNFGSHNECILEEERMFIQLIVNIILNVTFKMLV